jgi:hypothetical protein
MRRLLVFLSGGVVLATLGWFFLSKMGFIKLGGKYVCPVSGKYCRAAEVVLMGGEYYGLGFKIPEGEEYRAVIDSVEVGVGVSMLSATKGTPRKYRHLRLKGEEYAMVYVFNGEPPDLQGIIVSGDVLGKVPGEKVDELGDYSLVVFWEDKEGNRIEVLPKELK